MKEECTSNEEKITLMLLQTLLWSLFRGYHLSAMSLVTEHQRHAPYDCCVLTLPASHTLRSQSEGCAIMAHKAQKPKANTKPNDATDFHLNLGFVNEGTTV